MSDVMISPAQLVSVQVTATNLTGLVLINLQTAIPLGEFLGSNKSSVEIFLNGSMNQNEVQQEGVVVRQPQLTVRTLRLGVEAEEDLVSQMEAEVESPALHGQFSQGERTEEAGEATLQGKL